VNLQREYFAGKVFSEIPKKEHNLADVGVSWGDNIKRNCGNGIDVG
jgi:hypothetical protein